MRQRIGDQIRQELADPLRIAVHRGGKVALEADMAAKVAPLQLADDLEQRCRQVRRFAPLDGNAAAQPAPGEIEDVVDQFRHPPAALPQLPDQRRSLLVQQAARQPVEAGRDGSDGITQVMAQHGDELVPEHADRVRVDKRRLAHGQPLLDLDLGGDKLCKELQGRQHLGLWQHCRLSVAGADGAEKFAVPPDDWDGYVAFEAVKLGRRVFTVDRVLAGLLDDDRAPGGKHVMAEGRHHVELVPDLHAKPSPIQHGAGSPGRLRHARNGTESQASHIA